MMNKFYIKLIKENYPFPEDLEGSSTESWAEIILILEENRVKKNLLNIQWNALPLIEWFFDNQDSIASEVFDVLGGKTLAEEGIAQALYRIGLERFLDPPNDSRVFSEWAMQFDKYNYRHSLQSEMGGSMMPDILIGCNNGNGEISLFSEHEKWKYVIDMQGFLIDFHKEIEEFLNVWKSQVKDLSILNHISLLSKKINPEIKVSCVESHIRS